MNRPITQIVERWEIILWLRLKAVILGFQNTHHIGAIVRTPSPCIQTWTRIFREGMVKDASCADERVKLLPDASHDGQAYPVQCCKCGRFFKVTNSYKCESMPGADNQHHKFALNVIALIKMCLSLLLIANLLQTIRLQPFN